MKVKYIKVKGVDPTKRGHYFIKTKNSSFFKGDYFHSKDKIWEKTHKKDVEFWLLPVPDREEEMREMLEGCLKSLNWVCQNCKMPTIEDEHDAEEQVHHVGYRIQELTKLLNELKPN